MKINEVTKKIEPSKPRNFVAKNMTTGGAGAHKDKKKAEKQGDVKHKNKQYDMSESETRKFPDPRKPHFAGDHGSKSERVGKDGLIYHWQDPRARQHNHQGVAEGFDSEDLANEVYAEFERIYPKLARRAHAHTVHAAIIDVLNYGDGSNPSALAQDVARAVKRDIEQDVAEDGEPMKIKAVTGNDVTIDQGGQEIKTTADALAPGQQPGTFTMKPADPNSLKPGATVTQDTTTAESDDQTQIYQIDPGQDGIHDEEDVDLMGSGHNHDIGGDGTDDFIQDVRDAGFERANKSSELNRIKHLSGLR